MQFHADDNKKVKQESDAKKIQLSHQSGLVKSFLINTSQDLFNF